MKAIADEARVSVVGAVRPRARRHVDVDTAALGTLGVGPGDLVIATEPDSTVIAGEVISEGVSLAVRLQTEVGAQHRTVSIRKAHRP